MLRCPYLTYGREGAVLSRGNYYVCGLCQKVLSTAEVVEKCERAYRSEQEIGTVCGVYFLKKTFPKKTIRR